MESDTLPKDILAPADETPYEPSDVFAWANNLVQYKDELKIEIFFFNKNFVLYKTVKSKALDKQLENLFIDNLLEFVLEGAAKGLSIRGFEDAESEEGYLQRTRLSNVEKAGEVLNWLLKQEKEIEIFSDEEHDIKRMKGILARVSHRDMAEPFYVAKAFSPSNIIKGKGAWVLREGKFEDFEDDAVLRFPADNQLLIVQQDIYVFSPTKLKTLFGYDAKAASIAATKIRDIEEHYKLVFPEGLTLNSLIKGNKSAIKKLQNAEPGAVSQEKILEHAEDLAIEMMTDESGAIIIMDEKDLNRFINLMNDDYMESPLTGLRYEIKSKKLIEPPKEDEV